VLIRPATSGAAETLLTPFPFNGVRLAIAKAMHWRYKTFDARRHRQTVLEHVAGLPLLVMPGVLNPRLTRTGAFFAAQLRHQLVAPGAEVLDMGTGSGVCALVAAEFTHRVVAVDIDETAVRCATLNTLLNHAEDRVRVLQGDLFAPVAAQRFDLVMFNPPFLRGTPQNDADRAWRSTDVAERFASELRAHLRPQGQALVLLSSYGDPALFLREFRRHSFEVRVVSERRFVNEKLAVLRLT
jgi:release factor glutamine methyltransferase